MAVVRAIKHENEAISCEIMVFRPLILAVGCLRILKKIEKIVVWLISIYTTIVMFSSYFVSVSR